MSEAAVVTSAPTPAPQRAAPDIGNLTGDAYRSAKQEFIQANGEGAWRAYMESGAPAKSADPAPVTDAKPAAKTEEPAPKADGDEAEPDAITINADGKPIEARTGKFVPLARFMEKNKEAKESKAQLSDMMRRVVQTQDRLAQLLEPQEQTKAVAEPEKAIDPEQDVFGYLKQMAKRFETLEQKLTNANKATSEKLETTELREGFVKDAQRFAAKEPAFAQAYQHLLGTLHKEYEADGIADEGERNRMIAENIRDRATRMLKAGKSPAEAIWAIAQARGFQAKPAVDPNTEKEAAAKAELERINRTKSATQSLNGAGGGGLGEGLTVQKLASLAGEDFAKAKRDYIAKNGQDAWSKLLGA